MRTVQGLALSLSALALASSGCARSDLARKAHDEASTAPRVGNDDTNDAVDADEGDDEGDFGDDDQDWDGDDDPAREDDAGPPGNHGPMCPHKETVEVEGQCWEVRGLGDGCFPYGTDAMLDDVSLEECIRACDTSYECMYERRIGYAFGLRSCWLSPPCIAKGSPYTQLEYLGCVTGYDESWVWREQPSIDECDTVHPSWTRFDGLSIPECIETCEQVADCSAYRTVQYAIDDGTCIVDASCSPKPVGFAEISYEPVGACTP